MGLGAPTPHATEADRRPPESEAHPDRLPFIPRIQPLVAAALPRAQHPGIVIPVGPLEDGPPKHHERIPFPLIDRDPENPAERPFPMGNHRARPPRARCRIADGDPTTGIPRRALVAVSSDRAGEQRPTKPNGCGARDSWRGLTGEERPTDATCRHPRRQDRSRRVTRTSAGKGGDRSGG